MDSNKVFSKIQEFVGTEISLKKFQDLLESSNRNSKIRVEWETQDGNIDYYWMWWDSGAWTRSNRGGSETKAEEGMFNIQTEEPGKWRTLDLQTVSKCRFQKKLYIVKK